MTILGKSPAANKATLLEARFGPLLESIPEAIVIADSEGRITLINKKAEQLFGHSRAELLGKAMELLLPKCLHNGSLVQPQSLGATPDVFGLRKDGSEFPVQISLNSVQIEDNTWVVNTIHDFTDQKRIQQKLEEKSAALDAANQELQAFSYSISHDLRAPLRAMDGFANMLKKSLGANLTKETEHALKRIQDNAAKMSKLIDGLLDYATLTWVALTKRKVNTGELVQNVFNELTLSAGDRQVDFEIGELPGCNGDPMLLRQVFTHLLSNALKYTRDRHPTIIRVGCGQENGERVFFVQDNGVGFDMEYSGKLFHVFQRLHSPSEFEGTGVGLAIVQRIILRHGGRIWGEAQVDRGAVFYFTLGDSIHGHSA